MTSSNPEKILKQLEGKPAKAKKFKKHNFPKDRSCGKANNKCRRCGRVGAHISKYGIHLCRQCFREHATKIGFKQYS